MYDVIIIGMGMAGVTAGIYAKRAGLNVLMFEKKAPGGILMNVSDIHNYPGYEVISGPDLAMELFKQVRKNEIPYKMEEVLSIDASSKVKIVTTKNGTYECNNLVIATGRKPKFLGLDNEKDYLGRGLSTCATCDGFLYKNEDVAVVGSGNSALSESLYLANICKKVYLLHRNVDFKADEELINKVKTTDNIEIISNVTVSKINETDGKISSVLLSNEKEINVKGVFIYIGYKPDTELVKDLGITNDNGDIITNENKETKLNGVYGIGDCILKDVYQLVTAASDGAIAISKIDKR